ncbi:MAG: hypothetical protein IKV03_05795 [Alphaproteobacteria bacterium]|nr:hypothetical protein [Alphaproteobacteria bacterium]
MNFKIETGRSMVEMLGVLAIIGVLSIGGITGYSYGMDKYRANQTINDIMLRAVDLMTQASQGRDALSLDEWINEPFVYDFSNPAYSDDDLGLIMFDVGANNKISQRVCEMVYDGLSNSVIQIDINEQVSNSKNDCASDNTMTFYFEGGRVNEQGELICEPACGEGEQCANGFCFREDIPVVTKMYGNNCSSDADCGGCGDCLYNGQCMPTREGVDCPLDNGQTGQCNNGQCLAKEGCSDKNPCQSSGTYCASPNSSCSVAFNENETGICIQPDFVTQKVNGKVYYVSNGRLSWWDAKSACEIINREMISVNDVVVGWNQTASNSFERTELGLALNSIIGHGIYVWMEEKDDCYAWTFTPNDWGNYDISSKVKNRATDAIHYIAVCK